MLDRVGWSPPGVFSALSHVKSFTRSNTRRWDGQSAHKRHAQKHEPQSHTSLLRRPPASRVTPARTHPPFTHVPAASPVTPSTHCGSRSPSHARTITTPPSCRPKNADPVAPAWALAQQRSPPGPDSPQNRPDSVRAPTPCQKWASPHSNTPGQLSPNRDAGI